MKYKISAVNYLNSKSFIYGLEHSTIKNSIELQLDIPSVCAEKLQSGKVDIGLVPVAVLPELEEYHIISEYCIGADGEVGSVLLFSDVPLHEIKTILLDNQSRTSVMLVRVLAEKFWNIHPRWMAAKDNFETQIGGSTAGVVIGDRTFTMKNKFQYVIDLASEWKKFTTLPFVFACWVANKNLPSAFIHDFNEALLYGLDHRHEVVLQNQKMFPATDLNDYLENKISFSFDSQKKQALDLFLGYMNELVEPGFISDKKI